MTQEELVIKCFTEKGRITNADFLAEFKHFTGRNRVTAAKMKAYWAEKGYAIKHFYGSCWEENGWEIVPVPPVEVRLEDGQYRWAI